MKYYCMWHPVTKWGAPVPILLPNKRAAAMGTGVSLSRMRELGWRWVAVDIAEPSGEVVDKRDQLVAVRNEIDVLLALEQQLNGEIDAEGSATAEGK